MKTVVSVKIEKELWEAAKDLAEELGLPLSTVIGANLRQFVQSRKLVLATEPSLRPEVTKLLDQALAEAGTTKSTSPKFKNAKDALKWLKS